MHASLTFGPAHGYQGDKIFVPVKLTFPFQGQKLVAEDSSGARTRICQLYVDGQKTLLPMPRWRQRLLAWCYRIKLPRALARLLRRAPGAGMRTEAFAPGALGNGLSLPICPAGKEITIEIEFLSNGTWRGELWGQIDDAQAKEAQS